MTKSKSVTVSRFFKDMEKSLKLQWVSGRNGGDREITEGSIQRPGLALAGFFDYFADKRVHIIGMAEYAYLNSLSEQDRYNAISKYLEEYMPCIVFTRGLSPDPLFIELSNEIGLPVFISSMVSYHVINGVVIYLERELSPSITVVGNLVEVQGTGVLVRGASGVGKSECALALIRRGCALIADDVVKVSHPGGSSLIGCAAMEEMFGFIEIRGLGLINVIQLFGVSAFRQRKDIDLVITLKPWDQVQKVERTGLETENYRLLGFDIPHITLPVAPGRETANLVEIAAQEFRMRALGLHAGKVLNEAIIKRITPH